MERKMLPSRSNSNAYTVVARSDGKGYIKPFNSYTSAQAGAMVTIENKKYKVSKTGHVTIPKRVMEKYGTQGDDGRNRIDIKFATKRTLNGDHTRKVHTQLFKTRDENKNNLNGSRPAMITNFLPVTDEDTLEENYKHANRDYLLDEHDGIDYGDDNANQEYLRWS